VTEFIAARQKHANKVVQAEREHRSEGDLRDDVSRTFKMRKSVPCMMRLATPLSILVEQRGKRLLAAVETVTGNG
jgi:hypothetical protein